MMPEGLTGRPVQVALGLSLVPRMGRVPQTGLVLETELVPQTELVPRMELGQQVEPQGTRMEAARKLGLGDRRRSCWKKAPHILEWKMSDDDDRLTAHWNYPSDHWNDLSDR
jgi:hypothetical protein